MIVKWEPNPTLEEVGVFRYAISLKFEWLALGVPNAISCVL